MFWDGRAESEVFRDPVSNQIVLNSNAQLENQIAGPPVSAIEMGHPGRTWADVAVRVQGASPLALATSLPTSLQNFVAGQSYPQLFQQAFGTPGVDAPRIIMAIASYIRTLVSDQTPIDLFLAGLGPFPQGASPGFVEFGLKCAQCHGDVDTGSVTTGPVTVEFRNIGVRPIAEDRGRGAITQLPADDGKFKAPDLRNAALRAAFFHNGNASSLHRVLQFYDRGGDFTANQDPLMSTLQGQLPITTRMSIIAFLQLLVDPRVENETPPFDRPRLFSEGPNQNVLFGSGTSGTGGIVPRAIAIEAPRLGVPSLTVAVDGAQPNEHALIGLDIASASIPIPIGGIEVHLALTCATTLTYVGPLQGSAGPGSGHTSWSLQLTSLPSALGLSIYGQWLVTDLAVLGGFAASNAFQLTLF